MRRRSRGSGTIIKKGSTFAIRVGPRGADHFEGGFRSKLEAEQRLTVLRGEAMKRRLGHAADPRLTPTLSELAKDWLERRKLTHRAGEDDAWRWSRHVKPSLGRLRPDQVDAGELRAFVEDRRRSVAPGTVRIVVSLLSMLFEDLLERGVVASNPCRNLPRSTLRLMRSEHDPRTTAFVEKLEDVRRIYLKLRSPLDTAFAIGAMGGLRTGEVFALRWSSVDLEGRQLLVRESVEGPTKGKEARVVPILDPLLPVLKAWKLESGGAGLVIPPRHGAAVDKETPARAMRAALVELRLPPLEPKPWYQATRHTFASHWAMAGRPLRELQKILGHKSITDTERYAHLAPGYWAEGVHQALKVSLAPGAGSVAHWTHTSAEAAPPRSRKKGGKSRSRP